MAESQRVSSSGKIMRLAKDEKLEEVLYIWFVQKHSQGTPVSGPLLCEKATQFHEQMHREEAGVVPFKASGEWLWRFCQRHGIRQLTLQGEKLSADDNAIAPFQARILSIMEQEGLTLEQIYNCDKTGCYLLEHWLHTQKCMLKV